MLTKECEQINKIITDNKMYRYVRVSLTVGKTVE